MMIRILLCLNSYDRPIEHAQNNRTIEIATTNWLKDFGSVRPLRCQGCEDCSKPPIPISCQIIPRQAGKAP